MQLLRGLFHYTKGDPSYSVLPDAWPALPLYVETDKEPYVNDIFWWVLLEVSTWQNLSDLKVNKVQELKSF